MISGGRVAWADDRRGGIAVRGLVVDTSMISGRALGGPSPGEVLSVPVLGTVCLLSSSVTVALAVRALGRGAVRLKRRLAPRDGSLGPVFLTGTGRRVATAESRKRG